MKKISIGILVTLLSTPLFCQSDSLKVIGIVKWRLERLLDVYHYDLPKAEQSIVELNSTVQGFKIALEASGKLTEIRTLERDLKVIESDNLRQALTKTEQAGVLKEKQARKKGFISGIGLSGVVAIVLVLLL